MNKIIRVVGGKTPNANMKINSSDFKFVSNSLRCKLFDQDKVGSKLPNSSEYDGALGEKQIRSIVITIDHYDC